jgi:hypothetical protein
MTAIETLPQPVTLAQAAACYVHAGLPVLPLGWRTKVPACKRGFHDATLDADVVASYWHRHPGANIGIRPTRGVIVLDVDPRNGGDERLQRLMAEHGPLPPTWTAATGSGGQHLWFAVEVVRGPIRGHLCPGVDIKHGGTGYVVAPPSVHPSGGVYRWSIPPTGRPAPAPAWLRASLTHTAPQLRPLNGSTVSSGRGPYTLQCLTARIEGAPVGRRHDTVRGAFLDAARQGDLDAYAPILAAAAAAAERTPVEIDAIIRYARERGGR